jgi:hypothetical protein
VENAKRSSNVVACLHIARYCCACENVILTQSLFAPHRPSCTQQRKQSTGSTMQDQPRSNESVLVRVLRTYTYVAVWIVLSGVVCSMCLLPKKRRKRLKNKENKKPNTPCATSMQVILWNKHILAFSGFPYPITLTMW